MLQGLAGDPDGFVMLPKQKPAISGKTEPRAERGHVHSLFLKGSRQSQEAQWTLLAADGSQLRPSLAAKESRLSQGQTPSWGQPASDGWLVQGSKGPAPPLPLGQP